MLQNFSQTQGTVFHSSACISSSEGFFKNRSAHFCGKSPSSGACPSQIAILFSLWLKFLMKWKPTYSYGDLNFSDSQQVFVNLFSWRKLEGSLIIFWKFQGRTPQEIWITAIFPARSKVVSYDVLHHTERPRHWEYLPLPVYVAFFVVAFFVAPPGLPSPIHHCLGRCSCDRRLLSAFPPSETQNKRLPRRSPCWRSHLDQTSRSAGEGIDKIERLDLLWQRITQKLQIQPCSCLVPLDAFFHCAIDELDVMPSRPCEWDAVAMESLSALGCGFLYGRPLKG